MRRDPAEDEAAPLPTGTPDTPILWLGSAASTQDVARAARERRRSRGDDAPFAVATDDQRQGRGRLGRPWAARPGRSLAFTYVHPPMGGASSGAPADAAQRLSWYPLVSGLAALDALADAAREPRPADAAAESEGDDASSSDGADAPTRGGNDSLPGAGGEDPSADAPVARHPLGLKWPNDVHDADGRKIGGILVERMADGTILIGIGLNLRGDVGDGAGAPVPGAVAAGVAESPSLMGTLLARRLRAELAELDAHGGDAVASGQAARYRETCVTVGRDVLVHGVGDAPRRTGRATGIDGAGRLVVESDGAEHAVDVGDVQHVRPAPDTHDSEERG